MKANKNFRKFILPAAAGIMMLAAAIIIIAIPKKSSDKNSIISVDGTTNNNTIADVAKSNDNGELVIHADVLSEDQAAFIQISDDSRIELLARLGNDGKAKVALGTCQSCNGAPGAYYTQEEDVLKCNNCGLTFPLSVIDSPGGGCHPMMLDDSIIHYSDGDALINIQALSEYENLFDKVAEH